MCTVIGLHNSLHWLLSGMKYDGIVPNVFFHACGGTFLAPPVDGASFGIQKRCVLASKKAVHQGQKKKQIVGILESLRLLLQNCVFNYEKMTKNISFGLGVTTPATLQYSLAAHRLSRVPRDNITAALPPFYSINKLFVS